MKSPSLKLPLVAIAGRPNVGKSTLFNRLAEKRKSIVQRESGTTRDRIYENISWCGKNFRIVDTGGFQFAKENTLESKVDREVVKALEESALILLIVDGEAGLTTVDERFADTLRRVNRKVIVVVNKLDVKEVSVKFSEFFHLGFDKILKISATHGMGIGELLDEIVDDLPDHAEEMKEDPFLFSLSIVGEPNVGKSTYLNRLLNQERVIVSPIPGTTRDTVEELFSIDGKLIRLVDTAGIRQGKKIKSATELFSFSRTREAISMADVVVLLFDATHGIRRDSKMVVDQILAEKKGLILVANKWDLAKERNWAQYQSDFYREINYLENYPLFCMSGLVGKNVLKPIQESFKVFNNYSRKFTTHELNVFLEKIKKTSPPQGTRLKYLVQTGFRPLRFNLFVRHKEKSPKHYWNFFEHQFLEYFKMSGVGIRLHLMEEKE
ncbi:MAG: ribosome biogenesis GTPase Der [Candidatus Omnitrophica bacterium]|nr:ribosome biogenesis GTPase Der [Candidatus Omnitrophota bacterium]